MTICKNNGTTQLQHNRLVEVREFIRSYFRLFDFVSYTVRLDSIGSKHVILSLRTGKFFTYDCKPSFSKRLTDLYEKYSFKHKMVTKLVYEKGFIEKKKDLKYVSHGRYFFKKSMSERREAYPHRLIVACSVKPLRNI